MIKKTTIIITITGEIHIIANESISIIVQEYCIGSKMSIWSYTLVVVPSTYAHMSESELQDLGVNVVIYANHLLRSAYPAMVDAAQSILENSRAKEASDKYCMSIKNIITLVPEVN